MRSFVTLLVVFVAGCVTLFAGEPTAGPRSEKEIKALVGQLRSPNKEPESKYGEMEYPPEFDHEAQGKVSHAFHELYELEAMALPYLAEYFDNESYCLAIDAGCSEQNVTVAEVCRFIFESRLVPYRERQVRASEAERSSIRLAWPDCTYLHNHDLYDPKTVSSWFAARKNRSLRELQIEVLQGTIDEAAKSKEEYTAEDIAVLKTKLEKLQASGEPLKSEWWLEAK
jgi:hypothetical protein